EEGILAPHFWRRRRQERQERRRRVAQIRVIRSPHVMPFRALTGHRPLLELLARATSRQTLPPSLLFSGPDGVGKRSTAIALAQALNCEHPAAFGEGTDGCGACRSCTRIARGVHADVLVLEPGDSGAIKLDQVREAIERTA